METNNIKCIVAAINANGEPDLYFVKVSCTESEYENGVHYDLAKREAKKEGFDPVLAYDELDSAGRAMLGLFEWGSASVISTPNVQDHRTLPESAVTPQK